MKTTRILTTAAAALLLAALPAAAASELWLHVKVEGTDPGQERVTVNLPISVVEKALPMIPAEEWQDGQVVIHDAEFDAQRLRELWQEVKDSPDMNYVTVQSRDETVKVYKERGYLVARTTEATEHGSQVHARIPLAVVDALLSGEGNSLNLHAAIQALAAHGSGELVTVTDGRESVRVWIDDVPEAAE